MFTLLSGPTLMNKTAEINNPKSDTISNINMRLSLEQRLDNDNIVVSASTQIKSNMTKIRFRNSPELNQNWKSIQKPCTKIEKEYV
jgi:hypothetical protein